ncbi:hypothetical protein PROFUN_06881 [Planoprotostelium fungivorum]|uniref:GTP-binding protein Era n=1 Tax=Planoprotostelium fungivorum TaxID=1890364 RepID=A0A2P6NMX2_9EUKA|nr:hypothetical protein PROFUN_06881 [Planoprotostelium fungivorum]
MLIWKGLRSAGCQRPIIVSSNRLSHVLPKRFNSDVKPLPVSKVDEVSAPKKVKPKTVGETFRMNAGLDGEVVKKKRSTKKVAVEEAKSDGETVAAVESETKGGKTDVLETEKTAAGVTQTEVVEEKKVRGTARDRLTSREHHKQVLNELAEQFIKESTNSPRPTYFPVSKKTPPKPKKSARELNENPMMELEDEESLDPVQPAAPKSLRVALVGAPNAGKSTLVNTLVGQKVSITAPLSQTTRNEVLGIWTEGEHQIVFMDTPGIVPLHETKTVQKTISSTTAVALDECDLIAYVIDCAHGITKNVNEIIERLERITKVTEEKVVIETLKIRETPTRIKKPVILIVNKVDLVNRGDAEQLLAQLRARKPHLFNDYFFTSAKNDFGTEGLKEFLMFKSVERPWEHHKETKRLDSISDSITELVREQIYRTTYLEATHNVGVSRDGIIHALHYITVPKDTHKAILIGKKGAKLKATKENAEMELRNRFGRPVKLAISIKSVGDVRGEWIGCGCKRVTTGRSPDLIPLKCKVIPRQDLNLYGGVNIAPTTGTHSDA